MIRNGFNLRQEVYYDFHPWRLPLGTKRWGTNKNVVDDDEVYLSTCSVKSSAFKFERACFLLIILNSHITNQRTSFLAK